MEPATLHSQSGAGRLEFRRLRRRRRTLCVTLSSDDGREAQAELQMIEPHWNKMVAFFDGLGLLCDSRQEIAWSSQSSEISVVASADENGSATLDVQLWWPGQDTFEVSVTVRCAELSRIGERIRALIGAPVNPAPS